MAAEEDFSPIELAQAVIPVVANVFAQLGAEIANKAGKHQSPHLRRADLQAGTTLGKLAGELGIAGANLKTSSGEHAVASEKCIEAILRQLERACNTRVPSAPSTGMNFLAQISSLRPKSPADRPHANAKNISSVGPAIEFPTLRRIAHGRQDIASVKEALREFQKRSHALHEVESLIQSLGQIQAAQERSNPTAKGLEIVLDLAKDNTPEYPSHVNRTLYDALDLHTACACSAKHLKLAKLRLDTAEDYDGKTVPFEILFPASPFRDRGPIPGREIWHETVLIVVTSKNPAKLPGRRKVKFAGDKGPTHPPAVAEERRKEPELSAGDFCKHLERKLGFCLRFHLTIEGDVPSLRPDKTTYNLVRNVKRSESLSLAKVLRDFGGSLTRRDKFNLAYIIAKSVWQYYGSDWMKNPWTHNDIQFLEEQGIEEGTSGKILATYSPYFNHSFEEANAEPDVGSNIDQSTAILQTSELYHSRGGLTHRYPGVFALAILLIEVIQGHPYNFATDRPFDSGNIKKEHKQVWGLKAECTLLGKQKPPDHEATAGCYSIYQKVIEKCTNGKLFQKASYDPTNSSGLNERREILYREVVHPLKNLLELWESSDFEEPVQGRTAAGQLLPVPGVQFQPTTVNDCMGRHRLHRADDSPRSNSPSHIPTCSYPQATVPNRNQYAYSSNSMPNLERAESETDPHHATYASTAPLSPPPPNYQPQNRKGFKIAIICALKVEFNAVALVVDEFFDNRGECYGRAAHDHNSYRTGRIGKHNVVLALMPCMGKASAASVATALKQSYDGIELALLVGICGGVPKNGNGDDIILGDVIVSNSVIQYDFGRQYDHGFVPKNTPKENLGRANPNVLSFVGILGTDDVVDIVEENTSQYLVRLQRSALRSERTKGKYGYPGASEDRLFEPTYRHKHHSPLKCLTCNQCEKAEDPVCEEAGGSRSFCGDLRCDKSRTVRRDRLEEKKASLELVTAVQKPSIHIGVVASGDGVMRSGVVRDRIVERDRVIAFEMEAAGVWDSLPCVIIKGVCDYSDSHKDKKWQWFAAATAASAMKAILERYSLRDPS
ncbi:hypothetical protein TWF730_001680 [Orbilia blumenaviensis]|uniref:Nucleoside phosphorylase domain-containing protein n=1 Tax=Orbilia blumenaviensis TaxID=1796055 RepID=A0AAV9ULT1_9PEZI